MTCNKFKLTTVAALVLAATNANAALYKVVEVATPSSIVGASETFGVAIQPAAVTGTESCFTNATIGGVACDSFKLAGETRNSLEAISYREEVPFAMDA
ncbi:GlyGly-CTERM sorting domain-containing protein, partial [Vibrio sp. 10N.222.48.A3]